MFFECPIGMDETIILFRVFFVSRKQRIGSRSISVPMECNIRIWKSRWFLSYSFVLSLFSPWANSLCFWFCGVLWYLTTNYRHCNATATTIVHDNNNNHRLQREAACTQSVLCHKPYGCRPGCGGSGCGGGSGGCDATRPGREHGEPVRRHSRPSGPSTSPVNDCRSSNATRSRP